jgi:hypothetical protein
VDVKTGDRVSIDAFKVGQPRRSGTVQKITRGLSGVRYLVRWDDGHESFFSPSAGNLIVEGRGSGNARRAGGTKTKAKPKTKTKVKAKPKAKTKVKAKPKTKSKSKGAKRKR